MGVLVSDWKEKKPGYLAKVGRISVGYEDMSLLTRKKTALQAGVDWLVTWIRIAKEYDESLYEEMMGSGSFSLYASKHVVITLFNDPKDYIVVPDVERFHDDYFERVAHLLGGEDVLCEAAASGVPFADVFI